MAERILSGYQVMQRAGCGPMCHLAFRYNLLQHQIDFWHWADGANGNEERVSFDANRHFLACRTGLVLGWLRSVHAYKEGRLLRVIPHG